MLLSTEVEYIALTETLRGVRWILNVLKEIRPFTSKNKVTRVKTYVDNSGAISLVKDHVNSKRSKHVSLRNHYYKEQYRIGAITVVYINTKEQRADGLTKPKSPNLHLL